MSKLFEGLKKFKVPVAQIQSGAISSANGKIFTIWSITDLLNEAYGKEKNQALSDAMEAIQSTLVSIYSIVNHELTNK